MPGGESALRALGFEPWEADGEAWWRLRPDRQALDALYDGKAALGSELERLSTTQAKPQAPQGPGGVEGLLLQALQRPAEIHKALANPLLRTLLQQQPQAVVQLVRSSPDVQETLRVHPGTRQQVEACLGQKLPLEEWAWTGETWGLASAAPDAAHGGAAPDAAHGAGAAPDLAVLEGQLVAMGFDAQRAQRALAEAGSLEGALELLT